MLSDDDGLTILLVAELVHVCVSVVMDLGLHDDGRELGGHRRDALFLQPLQLLLVNPTGGRWDSRSHGQHSVNRVSAVGGWSTLVHKKGVESKLSFTVRMVGWLVGTVGLLPNAVASIFRYEALNMFLQSVEIRHLCFRVWTHPRWALRPHRTSSAPPSGPQPSAPPHPGPQFGPCPSSGWPSVGATCQMSAPWLNRVLLRLSNHYKAQTIKLL